MRFISEPAFSVTSDQAVADLVAFMLAFSGSDLPEGSVLDPLSPPGTLSQDTHAAVGAQVTVADGSALTPGQQDLIDSMLDMAGEERVDLIVKGLSGGALRGWVYGTGAFEADREGETISATELAAMARPGEEFTWTVVPAGSGVRLGIDGDGDGFRDGDERAVCEDPADAGSYPGGPGSADCDADFTLTFFDFLCFQDAFAAADPVADCDGDGSLTFFDFLCFQDAFAGCQ